MVQPLKSFFPLKIWLLPSRNYFWNIFWAKTKALSPGFVRRGQVVSIPYSTLLQDSFFGQMKLRAQPLPESFSGDLATFLVNKLFWVFYDFFELLVWFLPIIFGFGHLGRSNKKSICLGLWPIAENYNKILIWSMAASPSRQENLPKKWVLVVFTRSSRRGNFVHKEWSHRKTIYSSNVGHSWLW